MSAALDAVLAKIPNAKKNGSGWAANCPAHEDRQASLSITEGEDGRGLLYCHAGCTIDAICAALGITVAELYPPKEHAGNGDGRRVVATYHYVNADGSAAFEKLRYDPKGFSTRRKVGGQWQWKLGDAPRVLYRLPAVLEAAKAGATVYVGEGEKDVHTLERLGLVATCNFDGASKDSQKPKWRDTYSDALKGARVVLLPDNDDPGRAHMAAAAESLTRKGIPNAIIPPLDSAPGGDVSDAVAAGMTREYLEALADEALGTAVQTKTETTSRGPRFITAAELAAIQAEEIDYLCPPYMAAGTVVDLTGKVKGGKSTLALDLCRAVLCGGEFIGSAARRASVVYVTEERPPTFRAALLRAGIGETPNLSILFRHEAGPLDWPAVVDAVTARALEIRAALVVVDTLTDWAGLAGEQENDAGHALAAVRPLHTLAAAGPCVLMLRHERKSGGQVGDSGRGSSAFAGAADVLLSLAHARGTGAENRRHLYAVGRFDGIPRQAVIEYARGRYTLLGDEAAISRRDARRYLLDVLPAAGVQGLSMKALAEDAPEGVHRTTLQAALNELEADGSIIREQSSGRGKPWRYVVREIA